MVGRVAGVITALAVVGALSIVAQTSKAAEGECGPVTLDMLFPGLDANGDPVATPSEGTSPDATSTTAVDHGSSSTQPGSTTTFESTPTTTLCRSWVYEMVWPVAHEGRVFSGFGVDRDGGERKHEGADIVAPKMAPVVAVAEGVVSIIHNTPGEDCCWVGIEHSDGWQSWYIHLNNDTYLTDDGLGLGVRADLTNGSPVSAGEVIGWVGDSGNAEDSVPHLHFELHNQAGIAVDAVPSLQAAKSRSDLETFTGPYVDDDGTSVEYGAGLLASHGILWACDESGIETCPNSLAQPDDMADVIDSITGLTAPIVPTRQKRLSFQEFLTDAQLALVLGCDPVETCFQTGITAGDVARLADWVGRAIPLASFDEAAEGGAIPLGVIPLNDVRSAENGLRLRGLIEYCDPHVDDATLLRRAEAADRILWWIWGVGKTPCYDPIDTTS